MKLEVSEEAKLYLAGLEHDYVMHFSQFSSLAMH